MKHILLIAILLAPLTNFADDLPLAVTPGDFIVSEDFTSPDAVAEWRWGAGKWTVADGVLKGTETAERKHAAGIACRRNYHDAVIRFRFRFSGGKSAMLLLRNKFGNLCRVVITQSSMVITKDKPNLPKDTPEKTVVIGKASIKLKTESWHEVTAVVHGGEFAVTLHDYATLRGNHPAIDVDKTEIEFLDAGDSVFFDDLVARIAKGRK